jgi:hypothetical protein
MSEASKTTMDRLKESVGEGGLTWCNPSLDYFMCGISELRVNAKPHNKIAYPISKIMEVMESLDRNTMAKVFKSFRSSTKADVAADGHFH